MAEAGIPQRVQEFVADHIESVVQLEILLLLQAHRDKEFSAGDIARELRIDPAWAGPQLADLCARGLLTCSRGENVVFRYGPRTPELDETIGQLAQTYSTRRVSVTALIFSKPPSSVRSFADAFRFRRDKPNG